VSFVTFVGKHGVEILINEYRVLFPGALNSEFTNTMEFMQPAQAQAISTYRVMNQYGDIIDKEIGVETSDEEALSLYKNMVKR